MLLLLACISSLELKNNNCNLICIKMPVEVQYRGGRYNPRTLACECYHAYDYEAETTPNFNLKKTRDPIRSFEE